MIRANKQRKENNGIQSYIAKPKESASRKATVYGGDDREMIGLRGRRHAIEGVEYPFKPIHTKSKTRSKWKYTTCGSGFAKVRKKVELQVSKLGSLEKLCTLSQTRLTSRLDLNTLLHPSIAPLIEFFVPVSGSRIWRKRKGRRRCCLGSAAMMSYAHEREMTRVVCKTCRRRGPELTQS
jgi:hypothetical protein